MNAGPDVERAIAQWLVEESPGRAPDRIPANASESIDRTKQRRPGVAWREPVSISLRGLAAMAAIVALAIIGAGWVGRSTASVGTPAATSAASATPHQVTFAEYKSARDAICGPAITQVTALNAAAASFHPDKTLSDASGLADNLAQVIAVASTATDALANLTPPPDLAAEHAVDVARHRDSIAILEEAVTRLRRGDAAGGLAFADATGPLSAREEAYEQKYGLAGCP